MSIKKDFFILLIVFTLSILIRLPNLDRPLSNNYEWVTAHTLVTLEIWDSEGIVRHNFNPVYTFSNPNDHYIKCPISGISNIEGDYYYVSYPPFSFIFPHLIFELFDIDISPLSLQILNLFIHLSCSFLLYFILSSFPTAHPESMRYSALLGASFYILSPLNLWNHANVYFADILVQLFFLLTLLFFLNYIRSNSQKSTHLVLLGLSSFMMIYTEWLGILLAFVLGVFALSTRRKALLFCIILTSLTATVLIVAQYSSITGFEEYIRILQNRYTERSGQFDSRQLYKLGSHAYLAQMYLRNYFPYFVLILFTFFITLFLDKNLTFRLPENGLTLLLISFSTTALHHLILFEFTIVHELSLVKSSVFIAIILSFVSTPLFALLKTSQIVERSLYGFVLISMFSLGIYFYYSHVIKPTEYTSMRLGHQIQETSSDSDTIFFKSTQTYGDFLIKAPGNFVIAPQIQYYAGRCIQVVSNIDEAMDHLQSYNKTGGVIYTIENPFYRIEAVERIQNSQIPASSE